MIATYTDTAAWYCLKSQPKHEHIAAANLRRCSDIEVFSPRLRIRRAQPSGPVWVWESLFPGYLFAFFSIQSGLDKVRYTSGVRHIVQFGDRFPVVPISVISGIRASMGGEETLDHIPGFAVGEEVQIIDGPFRGFSAVIQQPSSAAQRVQVLLEFLGRVTSVGLEASQITGARRYPEQLLAQADSFPSCIER